MPIQYDRIGRNIRVLRKRKNLTQRQIAEKLGCSTEHFCLIKNGERHIQLEMLNALCETLEISYEDVLRGAINVPMNSEEKKQAQYEHGERFSLMVEGCSDEKINSLLEICRTILKMRNN